jgi:hypothetical protein
MVQRMGRIVRRKTDGRRARFVVAFIRDTIASLAPWPAPNPAGPGVLKPSASAAAAVHGHVVVITGIEPSRSRRSRTS